MNNITYLDDSGLGFVSFVDGSTGIIRWSDCGGSEIFARGGPAEAAQVDGILRSDSRDLPGDPEDDEDETGLVAFWGRVECAVRRTCGHACSSERDVPSR